MKFLVMSEREIKDYNIAEKHIVISITSPGYKHPELPPLKSRVCVLRLKFYDLDKPFETFEIFTKGQAKNIWEFFNCFPVTTVICQCEIGISRSAGVAAGLAKAIGQDDSRFFKVYVPNRLVYRLILEEANKCI